MATIQSLAKGERFVMNVLMIIAAHLPSKVDAASMQEDLMVGDIGRTFCYARVRQHAGKVRGKNRGREGSWPASYGGRRPTSGAMYAHAFSGGAPQLGQSSEQ